MDVASWLEKLGHCRNTLTCVLRPPDVGNHLMTKSFPDESVYGLTEGTVRNKSHNWSVNIASSSRKW